MIVSQVIARFNEFFPYEKVTSVIEHHGQDHYSISINDRWVCKVSKGKNYLPLKKEVMLLNALQEKITTHIPRPVFYDSGFLIYKKIDGVPLSISLYNALNREEQERLQRDLGQFFSELHNALPKEVLDSIRITKTDWPWSADVLMKHAHQLSDKHLHSLLFETIEIYKLHELELVECLIHNDMNPRNIIIDENKHSLSGVIDFADAAFDYFMLDLRFNYDTVLMPDFTKGIINAYSVLTGKRVEAILSVVFYRFVEFSRYFSYAESGNFDDLEKIRQRILNS